MATFRVPDPRDHWRDTLDRLPWHEPHRHQSRASAMRRAKTLGIDPEDVAEELVDRCGAHGDSAYERKIRLDVESFFGCTDSVCSTLQSPSGPKIEIDEDLFKQVTANPTPLDRLRALSPSRLYPDDDLEFQDEVIDALFGDDDPLLCCGFRELTGYFCTKRREQWRGGLRDLQFIVPQRMTKEQGLTRAGVLSWHSLDNCGFWEHLVVEFDEISLGGKVVPITLEQQAALALHLNERFGGLRLVVNAVNKSLHNWFDVEPGDRLTELKRYAESLGACSGPIRNRSQFVRMPGGLRRFDDGTSKRQSVLYFDDRRAKHYFNPSGGKL